MTDRENVAALLAKQSDIAQGLSRATFILGMSRDQYVRLMSQAAVIVRERAVSPFQCDCPGCGKKITMEYVNGQRKVKWDG